VAGNSTEVQIGLGVEGEGLHAILPVPAVEGEGLHAILPVPAVDGGHDGPRPPELRRKHVEEAIEVGGEP